MIYFSIRNDIRRLVVWVMNFSHTEICEILRYPFMNSDSDTRNIFQEICFLADSHKPTNSVLYSARVHHPFTCIHKHQECIVQVLLLREKKRTMNKKQMIFSFQFAPIFKFRSDNKWTNKTSNGNMISISIVLIIFLSLSLWNYSHIIAEYEWYWKLNKR